MLSIFPSFPSDLFNCKFFSLYTFFPPFFLVVFDPFVFHSDLHPYSCLFFLCLPFLTFSQVLARCTGPGQKERITPQQCYSLWFFSFNFLCSLPFFTYFSLSLGWKIYKRINNWKWLQKDKYLCKYTEYTLINNILNVYIRGKKKAEWHMSSSFGNCKGTSYVLY